MNDKDYEIVYSSDGSGKNLIDKNKKTLTEVEIVPANVTLKLRLEKNGRGGKTVTVVYDLPQNGTYFQKLAKDLKAACGTGGSFKGETIEIQGDKKNQVKELLIKKGFKVKG